MKFAKLISVILLIGTFSGCRNQEPTANNQLSGMWRLDRIESTEKESGNWTYDSTFNGWSGFIIYDGIGHMGVQITPKGYKDFDTTKDIDSLDYEGLKELAKLYQSNFVYFANYKISEGTIEHRRLSATNPKDWGTILIRDLEFRKDTLILTAHEKVWGKNVKLWWIKL